jgi:serine/threonine protein phosphatase PrpC
VSFDSVTLSRAGGREVNEDCVDVLHTPDASCWVIADGLGGHRGGAIASKLVVETALRSFQEHPEVSAEQIERHVAQAQDALLAAQRSDSSLAQMRSTIVVLVANDHEAVWGHVGDSRLYHLRGGRVVSRTRDHSVSQALVDGGQLDERQQGAHEDRSRLLRSLGKDSEPARPTIDGPRELCRDDAFLLCTDGFWEVLDEVAVEIDYAGSEDAAAWIDRLDARLRAQDIPLKDNYTVASVRVLNDTAPVPPPHDPRRSAASAAAGEARPRQSSGSMAAALGVMSEDAGAGDSDSGRSVFGAHRTTFLRILYASMAIVLTALLYTAWLAYSAYIARSGGRVPHDQNTPVNKTPDGGRREPKTSASPPSTSHAPGVSVRPVAPDPDSTSKSSAPGETGTLSGSAPTAPAASPSRDRAHYKSPADVPNGKLFRPAKNQEYPSLQAALGDVDGAAETIWIGPGDFAEDVAPIAAAITLKGAGRDRTSIAMTGAAGLILTGRSGGLEDLALTAAAGPAVLEVGGSFHGAIKHVRIHDGNGIGLLMRDDATPTIVDVIYENNRGGNYLTRDHAKPK